MSRKKELILILTTVASIIALIVVTELSMSCTLRWSKPEEVPSYITPLSTYYSAQGGMIALANDEPTVASIICEVCQQVAWPILESASGATIELKDEIIQILSGKAAEYGLEDKWLMYMSPALGLIGATFQPEITFQDGWLAILRGFIGGMIDVCNGTDTHKPGE